MKRQVYTSKFKAETVALAKKQEKTVSKIALDLGINDNMIRRWIQRSNEATKTGLPAFPGHGFSQDKEYTRQQKANKAEQTANEILKKGGTQLRTQGSTEKIYQFIQSYKHRYPIRQMTELLGISRSAYYKWSKGKELKR